MLQLLVGVILLSAIPGVGLVSDRGLPTGSNWGDVTAELLARTWDRERW